MYACRGARAGSATLVRPSCPDDDAAAAAAAAGGGGGAGDGACAVGPPTSCGGSVGSGAATSSGARAAHARLAAACRAGAGAGARAGARVWAARRSPRAALRAGGLWAAAPPAVSHWAACGGLASTATCLRGRLECMQRRHAIRQRRLHFMQHSVLGVAAIPARARVRVHSARVVRSTRVAPRTLCARPTRALRVRAAPPPRTSSAPRGWCPGAQPVPPGAGQPRRRAQPAGGSP